MNGSRGGLAALRFGLKCSRTNRFARWPVARLPVKIVIMIEFVSERAQPANGKTGKPYYGVAFETLPMVFLSIT